MAEKRMFAKSIVLSDDFLDMPATARCLYFTLNMLADDDGFVNSPKSIMRQCMASNDDMRILLAKYYLIPFDSGIVVIRHWRINNYLRNDRYSPTKYIAERNQLFLDENGAYEKIESTNQSVKIVQKPIPEINDFQLTDKAVDVTVEKVKKKNETGKKTGKPPLIEREPENDIEVVEKEYLLNYKKLYEQGMIHSKIPIVNWRASRKLTKEVLGKYGKDIIVEAVQKSINNIFCINNGYTLTMILSSGILAQLINKGRAPPKSNLSEKYDLGDIVEA